jgi:hypothetical protein
MKNLLPISVRKREELVRLFKSAAAFVFVVITGFLIARKIASVPTRRDVVAFITAVLMVPIVKFPAFGLAILCILPLFISWIRRLFYLLYDRVTNDPLLIIPDIIAALLIFTVIDKIRKGERLKSAESDLQVWIVLFIVYQFSRVFILNADIVNALQAFKFDVFFITTFFFAIYSVKNFGQIVTVLKFTSVLAFFIALYGIKQAFIGYTSFEELWLDQMRTEFVTMFISGTPRPFSTLQSPATFADFMLIGMIASAAVGSLKQTRGSHMYYLFIPVMGFALLLTSVRSNWVGAIAAIFIWFLIAHRTTFRKKLVFTIIVFFLGIPVSFLMDNIGKSAGSVSSTSIISSSAHLHGDKRTVTDLFVKERVTAITNPFEEYSMKARVNMWLLVLRYSVKLPQGPFGWGPGTFNAHNYYFTVLYETGYPGMLLLLYILFRIFRTGFRLYKEEENVDKRTVIRAIISMLASICVLNTTGPHTSSHPADIYFWGSAGLLLIMHRLPLGRSDFMAMDRKKVSDAT